MGHKEIKRTDKNGRVLAHPSRRAVANAQDTGYDCVRERAQGRARLAERLGAEEHTQVDSGRAAGRDEQLERCEQRREVGVAILNRPSASSSVPSKDTRG